MRDTNPLVLVKIMLLATSKLGDRGHAFHSARQTRGGESPKAADLTLSVVANLFLLSLDGKGSMQFLVSTYDR